MLFRPYILALLLGFLCLNIFAQNSEHIVVGEIEFEGLKRTKESYLYTFLQTAPEKTTTKESLENDVQQLKNIASIGHASYHVDTIKNKLRVTFKVEEVRTLLPILNFGGVEGNIWYRAGFSDINWRGKGQMLNAYYQNNDRRHSGQVYYRVPYFKNTTWGFSASLTKWASREPLFFSEGTVNYDYDNNSIALSAIKHFNLFKSLEFGVNYFVENYSKSEQQFLENPPGPDGLRQPKILTKTEYYQNNLNYHFFYLSGSDWRTTVQNVYNTLDASWFHSVQFQGRKFLRTKENGNLAFRLKMGISTNNDTPFAPFVADSHVNIRGVGNRIDRGTAQIILNAEYRHALFQSNRWAAQAVVFSDMGTWRKPGGELGDLLDSNQFRHFVGGGFRLIYQKIYGAVFRIDYGAELYDKKQRGVVIGLGQYF